MEHYVPLVIVLIRFIGFGIFLDLWFRFRKRYYLVLCCGWLLYSLAYLPLFLLPVTDLLFIVSGVISCIGLSILLTMVFNYIDMPGLRTVVYAGFGAILSGLIFVYAVPVFDGLDFISLSQGLLYLMGIILALIHNKRFRNRIGNTRIIFFVVMVFGLLQTLGGLLFDSERFLSAFFPVSASLTVLLLIFYIFSENNIAQKDLKNSNQRFISLVQAVPMGITEHDVDGRITFANQAMSNIHGYSLKELLGGYLWDVQVDDEGKDNLRTYFKMLITETPVPGCYLGKNRKKNGEIIDVRVDWNYKRNDKGEVIGFIAATTDITKELEEEERAQQDEAIKRSIIDSPTSINIWAVDREYRYVFFNKAHEKAMKWYWDADIRLGVNILDFIKDTDYREEVREHYEYVLEGNTFIDIDRFPGEQDEDLYFENIPSPVRGLDGNTIGLTVFTTEITARVRAEQELQRSLEEKEVLLKEVHHRVKNNLQIITSLLSLQRSRLDPEQAPVIFQECQNRITSMTLIHELLYKSDDLSSLDMEYYFDRLIHHILDSYEIVTTRYDIILDVEDISLDLERTISLGLMINEFVSNTAKHAYPDRGNTRGEIRLSLKRVSTGTLLLEYSDHGKGLPDTFSLSSISTLGLKLVSSIVKRHKGTFFISGKEGVRISIELPLEGGDVKSEDPN